MDARNTLSEQEAQPVHDDDLAELRTLLLGDQIHRLEELRKRLDDPALRLQDTSRIFAEALAVSVQRDKKVHRVLQPIVEESLRISVERDPKLLASALFPIVGQAVRKSVAHSLQHMVDSLNSVLAEGFSLRHWRWRLEAIRSGKSFGEVALSRSLNYTVEHVYLIHRETGLLLAENSSTSGLLEDADMVVGMLTALQDFVRDSFTNSKQEDLEVLDIGEYKVSLLHGPSAILAVVVRGQLPEEIRQRLAVLVEQIHEKFHAQLNAFSSNGKPIEGLEPYLDGCLLKAAPAEKISYTGFKIAAGFVIALALAALFVQVRDRMRWHDYLRVLRGEPGIIIIDARRGWFKSSIAGLRDPLALQPESLLPEFNLSAKNVSENWVEYLSLDPRFVNARRLDAEAASLRKMAIRFEVDSTKIPLDQLPLVDSVSDQIHQLSLDAASQGQDPRVKIFGHTDQTGAESRNVELSQQRAETMIHLLSERGIDQRILSAEGVGDKQPQRVGADAYEQNLDRRVTFMVTFEPATTTSR